MKKGSELNTLEEMEIYKVYQKAQGNDYILNEMNESHSIFNVLIHPRKMPPVTLCPVDNVG